MRLNTGTAAATREAPAFRATRQDDVGSMKKSMPFLANSSGSVPRVVTGNAVMVKQDPITNDKLIHAISLVTDIRPIDQVVPVRKAMRRVSLVTVAWASTMWILGTLSGAPLLHPVLASMLVMAGCGFIAMSYARSR